MCVVDLAVDVVSPYVSSAWRAPLHTQLRAVCEPQQTALRGSRNAVEEERFCFDYQNRLAQYSRYIEPVPISNHIKPQLCW